MPRQWAGVLCCSCVILHWVNTPQCIHPFYYQWAFGLFPVWGYYECAIPNCTKNFTNVFSHVFFEWACAQISFEYVYVIYCAYVSTCQIFRSSLCIYLVWVDNATQVSRVVAPVYMLKSNIWELRLHCIFAKICVVKLFNYSCSHEYVAGLPWAYYFSQHLSSLLWLLYQLFWGRLCLE